MSSSRPLVLRHLHEIEPRLRQTCTHEIDATQPLWSVVSQLAELGRDPYAQIEFGKHATHERGSDGLGGYWCAFRFGE